MSHSSSFQQHSSLPSPLHLQGEFCSTCHTACSFKRKSAVQRNTNTLLPWLLLPHDTPAASVHANVSSATMLGTIYTAYRIHVPTTTLTNLCSWCCWCCRGGSSLKCCCCMLKPQLAAKLACWMLSPRASCPAFALQERTHALAPWQPAVASPAAHAAVHSEMRAHSLGCHRCGPAGLLCRSAWPRSWSTGCRTLATA